MAPSPAPPGPCAPHGPTRRSLLGTAAALPALLSGAVACGGPARRGEKPSLLVLVADDTSRLNIGAFGDPVATTPRVDRLAAEGLRFDNAYTPVGICTPSRTSMYTGLYPSAHGATGFDPIHAAVPTCPELLNPAGVATGLIGKVHVEPASKFPFEYFATGDSFLRDRSADAFTGAFEEFLGMARGRPFACFVNFKDPHRPFGHKKEESEGGAPRLHDPDDVGIFPFLWDTPMTRVDLARFYDALARMDVSVGRILDALEASGRGRDTLVVFTSDNGMPFPYAKATLYEAGINLPLSVRWPGVVAPGGSSAALISLLDLMPTALDLFGLDDADLHGRSLLPLLRGEVASVRDDWFAMHTSQKVGEDYPSRSLRVGDVKYIRNLRPEAIYRINGFNRSRTWQSWLELLQERDVPELQAHIDRLIRRPAEELYDLAADPFERVDLAPDPAHAATLEDMRRRLVRRMEEFSDREGLALVAATGAGR